MGGSGAGSQGGGSALAGSVQRAGRGRCPGSPGEPNEGKGGIPAGATLLLAFSTHGGASLGVGGWITGPVPNCVSLPAAPGGQGGIPAAG